MSYPVRVIVKEMVRETITADDEVRLDLCADPVLARKEVRAILEQKLKNRGWTPADGAPGRMVKEEDGVSVEWNLDEQDIVLRASGERLVEREEKLTLRGDSWTAQGSEQQRRELEARGREELRKKAKVSKEEREQAENDILADVQEKLIAVGEAAAQEANQVLEEVYRDWLMQQAKTLGNVVSQQESVSNDGSVYELTIKIDA